MGQVCKYMLFFNMRSEHQGQGYNLVTALGHGLQNHILQGLISAKYPMNLIGRMPNQNCIFHKDTSTTSLTGIAGFILSSQWSFGLHRPSRQAFLELTHLLFCTP